MSWVEQWYEVNTMVKRLINWIKSCFAGSIAVNDKNRSKLNMDLADKKARYRGCRGKLNG